MKKISIIILCLVVAVGIIGCTNNKTFDELDADPEYNEVQTAPENEPDQKLSLTKMSVQSGYSDGYAWMWLSSDEYSSLNGIVSKEGKVIAAFPTGNQTNYEGHSEFEDGYAIIIFDTEVDVLDTNGDIISTQQLGEDNQLVAYGAGYTVIENHIHDFDHNSYEYIFYNPNGEEVTKYVPEDGKTHDVAYIGGGVFSFNAYADGYTNDIYFTKANQWVRHRISPAREDNDFQFENSHHITFNEDSEKGILSCSWSKDEGGKLTIADKNGNITDYPLSIKPKDGETIRSCSVFCDNYCLVVDYYSGIDSTGTIIQRLVSVLNLDTGVQTPLSDEYTVDEVWDGEKSAVFFDNNIFSVPLRGEDDECYVGLFDVNCNLLIDPIRVDSYSDYSFSDGRLIVKHEDDNIIDVYSADGKKLYTMNEVGSNASDDEVPKYSDGILLDTTSELANIQVYDLDGNIPYTTLDTADTKILFYE